MKGQRGQILDLFGLIRYLLSSVVIPARSRRPREGGNLHQMTSLLQEIFI